MSEENALPQTTEVKLNGHERLWLSTILPREGHAVDLMLYRELREQLSLTAEELKVVDFDPAQDIQKLSVAKAAEIKRTFDWPDSTLAILRREVRKKESSGKLPDPLLDFWKSHVDGK